MIPRYETTVTPRGYEEVPVPSKFLRYWQNQLPDVELRELQLSSGAIAPSEGVILDSTGKPVAQAVGKSTITTCPLTSSTWARPRAVNTSGLAQLVV